MKGGRKMEGHRMSHFMLIRRIDYEVFPTVGHQQFY